MTMSAMADRVIKDNRIFMGITQRISKYLWLDDGAIVLLHPSKAYGKLPFGFIRNSSLETVIDGTNDEND
jgi:hypothetical protein